jgi:hypothetical protein
MKPHTNSTCEDAGTTSHCHNMLMRPPNMYVLCSSTDMGSMGTHRGMVIAMDAHHADHIDAASARSTWHWHTHGG